MITNRTSNGAVVAVLLATFFCPVVWAQDATLEILCFTDGATVYVDDEEVATTPMLEPVFVTAGEHMVRVERAGFLEYEEAVWFDEEDDVLLEVALLPFGGVVRIITAEAGATVLIDGEEVGTTPYEGEVRLGEHTFTVQREFYIDWEITEVISAGEEYFFEADLEPTGDQTTTVIYTDTTEFYEEWWFWTSAAVVIGGTVVAVLLLSEDEQAEPVNLLIELPLFP